MKIRMERKMNNIFRKRKWTEEQERWLIEHKDISGKILMYEEFKKAFPNAEFTVFAIASKRTELGAFGRHTGNLSRRKPLYSEQEKKGYVRIKVAQPDVWWQKQKWVWVETHPGEPFERTDKFMFLDGNNRNFNSENIRKVSHRVVGIINRAFGGLPSSNAEINDVFITKIELRLAMLDIGEKFGLVSDYGGGRMFREHRNYLQRKYREKRKRKENDNR